MSQVMIEASPSEMPEIPRELTMLRGAVTALETKLNHLLPHLDPLLRNEPELTTRDDGYDRDHTGPGVFTGLGRELRELTTQVGQLEDAIEVRLNRIQL